MLTAHRQTLHNVPQVFLLRRQEPHMSNLGQRDTCTPLWHSMWSPWYLSSIRNINSTMKRMSSSCHSYSMDTTVCCTAAKHNRRFGSVRQTTFAIVFRVACLSVATVVWVLWFPPISKDKQVRWTGIFKVSIGVKASVNECLSLRMSPVMDVGHLPGSAPRIPNSFAMISFWSIMTYVEYNDSKDE